LSVQVILTELLIFKSLEMEKIKVILIVTLMIAFAPAEGREGEMNFVFKNLDLKTIEIQ
jgi:hypothetical protein